MASAPSRIDKLEAAIRELRKITRPQAIREALVMTDDPRGYADWTRIVDSTGALVAPPRRALQFPGAVVTDSPTTTDRGATVVTIATSSGLAGVFSDDNVTTDAERIKFVGEAAPTINRFVVNTSTTGTNRVVEMILAEDVPTSLPPATLISMQCDETAGTASLSGLALSTGPNVATATYTAQDLSGRSAALALNTGGAVGASLTATDSTGGAPGAELKAAATSVAAAATARVTSSTDTGVSQVVLEARDTASVASPASLNIAAGLADDLVAQTYNAGTPRSRVILRGNALSNYMQAEASTASTNPVRRITRGPFTVSVAALAAGGTQASTLTNARNGSDYVVEGGINGAAGSELLQWSWVNAAGANDVTINITNTDPTNALTATLRFYVTSVT